MATVTYFQNGAKMDKFLGGVTRVTSSYGTSNEYIILADATAGAVTITLELASSVLGKVIHVKKIDSTINDVIITVTGSDTIDGAGSVTINTQYTCYSIIAGESGAWYII